MNTKRVLVVTFLIAVVAVGALSASMVMANAEYNPKDGEKWHTDFETAQAEAASTDQPMVVYFWSENCQYCEQFSKTLQNDGDLQGAADEYVMVSVELRQAPELGERYDVSGTPTMVVVTPDGTKVRSFVPTSVDDPASELAKAYETARQ